MKTLLLAAVAAAAGAQTFPASPTLDDAIEQAIRQDRIPGAVLVVGHQGSIVHRKAYGNRALDPAPEPMTVDTIFDCASLTKVVATTSSVMKLFEEGKIRIADRVTEYLPEFQGGKSPITVRDLLTHFSGMRPDVDLKPEWTGYETGVKLALIDKPRSAPGTRFVYSDINFILLGEIVRRVSGRTLPEFARDEIFQPLEMNETTFRPPLALRERIAPTEKILKDSPPLRGIVHDPTTRNMGGVAGHAGMFSTADDLAKFAQMMLGQGEINGKRIFSPLTIAKFASPQTPPDQPILRGLGWDIDSTFSGVRGELFPLGSYGHTGFTGTSMWIDPASGTFVILLANSVHPNLRPAITPLRRSVSTIAAAALGTALPGAILTGYNEIGASRRQVAHNGQVLTGLDVLAAEQFAPLKGKRVGLITNHTGLDRDGRRNIDRMLEAGVKVSSLFSPEHGIAGREDHGKIGDAKDPATGIRIWSLYAGQTRRPTPEMLRGLDALVFDVQDIGVRFYTYVSTMAYAMEEAAKHKLPFYVLDRPNPLTGVRVEGPILDRKNLSFIGYFPLPLRHGMTIGELARMFNAENRIQADLHVVPMKNWERGDWYDSTGLLWTDPSPNMRNLTAAVLYPGIAMLEYSKNYSVGRGTETPFEVIGAEFIRGRELADYLNRRLIPGLRVYPVKFGPKSASLAGKTIEGVRLIVVNREILNSQQVGLEVAAALQKLYPGKIRFEDSRRLIGSEETIRSLVAGDDPREILRKVDESLPGFLAIRDQYLLYR
ncbi:MAG: exo-beta-N-acetylmuramidase NamZ domain-containing protein [Bryobacteraceae bacterium]